MKKAIMENHLGGYYVIDKDEVEKYSQRCEQCGDSDWCIDTFDTNDIDSLNFYMDIPVLGYLNEVVENSNFSKEKIKKRLREEFELKLNGEE